MKHQTIAWLRLQRQRLSEHGLRSRCLALLQKILRHLLHAVRQRLDRHPRLRRRVIQLLERIGIKHLVMRLQNPATPRPAIALSPRGQAIRNDLQRALARLEKP